MNILIFNHHALTPDMGGGTRHYDFAKELVKRGHKVTIVASSFHYASCKEMKRYKNSPYLKENIDGIEFIWIKTPPYKNNGVKRVINMLTYMHRARKIEPEHKADVIIGSSVHLFAVYAAYKTSKRLKTPFIMEVRDIWPQTLIDMGISKWHPFILILGYLEKFLYKRAQKIITLAPYAYKHIEKFGIQKDDIVWISNGVDISRFKNIDIQKDKNNKFHIRYAGSMGIANVLHTLLDVAKELKEYKDIKFELIGEGALKDSLISYKKIHNLDNVEFQKTLPKNEVAAFLKGGDVLYVGLKDSPLYRFGISLNKLFDYIAAEVPIIFAGNSKNNPVKEAKAGICITPEDVNALKNAILKIYKMDEKGRTFYAKDNLNYLEKNFSIQFLTDKLEKLLIQKGNI